VPDWRLQFSISFFVSSKIKYSGKRSVFLYFSSKSFHFFWTIKRNETKKNRRLTSSTTHYWLDCCNKRKLWFVYFVLLWTQDIQVYAFLFVSSSFCCYRNLRQVGPSLRMSMPVRREEQRAECRAQSFKAYHYLLRSVVLSFYHTIVLSCRLDVLGPWCFLEKTLHVNIV